MQKIAIPSSVKYEEGQEAGRGKIIVEPFYPGYGITLGNSIRRVLLSSLEGAAPVGIKIKGADHEFAAIPHLKEDILEFILNLKKLRLKIFSEEPVRLELDVHGKKDIKASDIKANSQVEIVNPDLVLGHITDMSGSLYAEIFVAHGMGYEMIETRENKEKEIGYIEMDSVYTPVTAVGVKIENVRVGKMTNWERLILDITTDCTITPAEAFNNSVKILLEQFNALISKEGEKEEGIKEEAETEEEKEEEIENSEEEISEEATEKEETDDEDSAPKRKRGRPKKSAE
ncbi:DNA-directed RNA polymerase subunit alpha [Candidatus Falkowbacteria bacterium RIFOXYB2_FULL_47_14]|uniref:DNA-directed RNA polymerase subunit alpha n=1 Tax=Candidatus Falkowbacteria bacterium RIFOXYA2_FULL_47_19 TaxID=1797994 RepID=A0A1F5SMR3_9BACT|nr:MAG: DNA-directed RNA polymerase subunit alpha [Candidatus Falkowbacteria bacterium RIFOXYA2_FULL_47_19]OGF35137.1 MAG: DNA-directed RNA polymerase subunit alpha [Candidatus Falkowbacteria bacterium RIFOXYC2_FULL_46_15]OGF43144.1 MAG: DNA-directed RNA polymerase subunit alpha [Candidatus Falkowbacteria bacterium RIFOXYB2_FULL_47_14]